MKKVWKITHIIQELKLLDHIARLEDSNPNPLIRSQMLYPIEPQAQEFLQSKFNTYIIVATMKTTKVLQTNVTETNIDQVSKILNTSTKNRVAICNANTLVRVFEI